MSWRVVRRGSLSNFPFVDFFLQHWEYFVKLEDHIGEGANLFAWNSKYLSFQFQQGVMQCEVFPGSA
jgi:hypothetical protein